MIYILAFLIGSIPFGFLLPKWFGYGDVRNIGSGNVGATNVLRLGDKKLAALVLILDALKGYLATQLSSADMMYLLGLLAVVGHIFTPWLKGKGGKGVATGFGVLVGVLPWLGGLSLLVWIAVAYLTRYSSLAALSVCLMVFAATPIILSYPSNIYMFLMIILIVLKHHENIRRLWQGTEGKINFG
jgi:acyl phosphate:glycerol-3-phosphate acyltransferase